MKPRIRDWVCAIIVTLMPKRVIFYAMIRFYTDLRGEAPDTDGFFDILRIWAKKVGLDA